MNITTIDALDRVAKYLTGHAAEHGGYPSNQEIREWMGNTYPYLDEDVRNALINIAFLDIMTSFQEWIDEADLQTLRNE